jgi:hypothetical protein
MLDDGATSFSCNKDFARHEASSGFFTERRGSARPAFA